MDAFPNTAVSLLAPQATRSAAAAADRSPGPPLTVAEVASPATDAVAAAREYLRALRPQHWLKNLLAFVPLLAAHLLSQPALLARALAVFLAFCCCASSGYLVNDLCDLSADRRHPLKRLRPFASGRLPPAYAWVLAPALAVVGCLLAWRVSALTLSILVLCLPFVGYAALV